jgi:hypothetical protein
MRLIVDIQPGGGAWDLAEDVVTFLNGLAAGSTMAVEVDRSKVEADEPEMLVKVTEEDAD